jgi:LPXTG-motif cell wall-anchored protein
MIIFFPLILLASCHALVSTLFNMTIPTSFNPSPSADNDRTQLSLGVQFFPTVAGSVTALMFLKNNSATSERVCTLYTTQGTELARVSLPRGNETGNREWQVCRFATPVAVMANVNYIASIWTQGYLRSTGWFSSQDTTSGDLVLRGSGSNAHYEYSSSPSFPDQKFNANYWIDVRFETPTPPPTPAPSSRTPSPTPRPSPISSPTLTMTSAPTPTSSTMTQAPPTPVIPPVTSTRTSTSSIATTTTKTSITSSPSSSLSQTLLVSLSSSSSKPTESQRSTGGETDFETASIDVAPKTSDTGMWIGIGVGLGVCLLALLLLIVWVIRRRRRQSSGKQSDRPMSETHNSKSEYGSLEMTSAQVSEYASARAFDETTPQRGSAAQNIYQTSFPANESNASTSMAQYQAI